MSVCFKHCLRSSGHANAANFSARFLLGLRKTAIVLRRPASSTTPFPGGKKRIFFNLAYEFTLLGDLCPFHRLLRRILSRIRTRHVCLAAIPTELQPSKEWQKRPFFRKSTTPSPI